MSRVLIPIARDMQAQRQHCIKLICTDVDGTLLNSNQQLTDGVIEAVQQAYNVGIPVRPRLIVTAGIATSLVDLHCNRHMHICCMFTDQRLWTVAFWTYGVAGADSTRGGAYNLGAATITYPQGQSLPIL